MRPCKLRAAPRVMYPAPYGGGYARPDRGQSGGIESKCWKGVAGHPNRNRENLYECRGLALGDGVEIGVNLRV